MKSKFNKLVAMLLVLTMLFSFTACDLFGDTGDDTCEHRDADDNALCDKCGEAFTDGTETPDTPPATCEHRDADDNGLCDKCGETFSDGTETPDTPPVTCEHRDANDDALCDKCGEVFYDGDEEPECEHRDADDNGKCDKCDADFEDEVDIPVCEHRDADDDKACDKCGEPFEDQVDIEIDVGEPIIYTELEDGTLSVKKGGAINTITKLEIPALHEGKVVSIIEEAAFQNCGTITSVEIPDTIKLVGNNAFNGCTALTAINVYKANEGTYETIYSSHEGVLLRNDFGTMYLEVVPRAKTGKYTISTEVDNILAKAFNNSSLSEIVIPDNVVSIPKNAFYYCKSLTTITFAEGRKNTINLDNEAFYNCTEVVSISFSANIDLELSDMKAILNGFGKLQYIGVEANGNDYASIDGILTDAEDTILYCPKAYAKAFTVPQGINTIAQDAFSGRVNVTAITIPTWVKSIGKGAFYGCYGVRTITFAGNRSLNLTIGDAAFANHRNLETVTFEASTADTLDVGVITIGTGAFAGNSAAVYRNLETVTIGKGVNIATVGNSAFKNNSYLSKLNIDDTARIGLIDERAFENCEDLTSVKIPASVTEIDQYAFANCESLAAVDFKTEGATAINIKDYAFYNCSQLKSITLPDHLGEFRSSAFDGCENLNKILVNSTNESYMNDANGILYKKVAGSDVVSELLFYPKGLVNTLGGVINNLPETLTSIGGAAFSNNPYLVSITIPKSVTKIDDSAFSDCEKLANVIFAPGGTTLTIGNAAFKNCRKLTGSLALPAYTTSIGNNAFENCDFAVFTIPAGVTSIGNAAFYNCQNLTEITFNCTGDLTIGEVDTSKTDDQVAITAGTFANCVSLESVYLPAGTKAIGKYAFYGCTSLNTLQLGKIIFNGNGGFDVDSKLEVIHDFAFSNCTALTSVYIPKSVTAIGEYAFAMNVDSDALLSEITFEENGAKKLNIGKFAFANLPELTEITFPARVTLMTTDILAGGNDAAGNALYAAPDTTWALNLSGSKYNSITKLETNMPALIKDTFYGCTSLAEINIANDVVDGITPAYSSLDGVLYNSDKSVLIYCPVANVGIYNGTTPTYEIKVPTSVKLVASFAFNNCTALKTVTFLEFAKEDTANYANQLLTIGNVQVYTTVQGAPVAAIGGNNSSITTINLPSHLGTVNMSAFVSKAKGGIDININPDANKVALKRFAFDYSRAKALDIDASAIDQYTFSNNPYLASIDLTLASTITALPNNLFFLQNGHNDQLTSFVIPDHVTQVGNSVFYDYRALSNVNIDKLTKIGSYAFYNTALTSVVIPVTITSDSNLGAGAFQGCKKLTSISVAAGSSLKKIPNYLCDGCTSLVTADFSAIAGNVTSIGSGAFQDCIKLTSFDFSQFVKVTTISASAFYKTGLSEADLSATKITTLSNVFTLCPNLTSIKLPTTVKTSFGTTAVTNIPSLQTLEFTGEVTAAAIKYVRNYQQLKVIIPASNTTLVKEGGVIYDKAKTNIYWVDCGIDLSTYTIPSTVTTISDYAFGGTTLGDLVIPTSVTTIGTYAFQYATANSITIPATVTSIGNYAFQRSNIPTVNFADAASSKLTKLGTYTFQYSKLQSIVIPNSVTSIGTSSFMACSDLKSITFGSGLTSVPGGILNQCTNLETIVFSEGTTTIGYVSNLVQTAGSTSQPNKITTIKIPATVTKIDASAFANFTNLETVEFAAGSKLSSIGNYAFHGCEKLTGINLPNTVSSIGQHAFYGCKAFTSIDLEGIKATSLGYGAFQNTPNLAVVKLPAGLVTVGSYAFADSGIKALNVPATVTTIAASAFENATGLVSITFTNDSKMLNLTGASAFKNTTALTTLVMPNTLKNIGASVFENSALKTVTLTDPTAHSELKTIGAKAFANCSRLEAFDYLGNATNIGDYAFMNCYELTAAAVAEGLVELGNMAFAFCNKLPVANIPSTVTTMVGNPYAGLSANKVTFGAGNDLFTMENVGGVITIYDIDKLVIYGVFGATGAYTFADSIRNVAPGALAGNAITSVTVPARFGQINEAVFMFCSALTSVTIENGITVIGKNAFNGSGLTTVSIPKTVTMLGDYAFSASNALNNVVIPANVTTLGNGVFSDCTALSNVSFADSKEFVTLGTHTFAGCTALTQVVLPTHYKNTVKEWTDAGLAESAAITEYALPAYTFAGTGIQNAVLPRVDYVNGKGVFENCKSLVSVTLNNAITAPKGTVIKSYFEWFDGCDNFAGNVTIKELKGRDLKTVNYLAAIGIKNIHVKNLAVNPDDYMTTLSYNNADLSGLAADVNIYFDGNTYADIVEYLKYYTKTWSANIYDKDGNKIIRANDSGIVASVENADGEVIFTNTVTSPVADPDDD